MAKDRYRYRDQGEPLADAAKRLGATEDTVRDLAGRPEGDRSRRDLTRNELNNIASQLPYQ